jgi:hypothetical protein
MSYISILSALISLATQNPQIFARFWAAVTDAYQASLDMVEVIKAEFADMPVPRDMDDATITPDEVAAEQRLTEIIGQQGVRAFGGGKLGKIVAFLKTNPIGQALLAHLLGKLGS